ncbi:YjbH domain-containing protein [Phaeobacter sp. CNT1-3]|nr:YjbH domain-containing protein [Phaeobacter sp. CNT1-3]
MLFINTTGRSAGFRRLVLAAKGTTAIATLAALLPHEVAAQDTDGPRSQNSPSHISFDPAIAPSHNLYGMPGLIDLPTADVAPDAQLTTTIGHFANTTRTSFSFQLLPRLTTSFRYTALADYVTGDDGLATYYDRSFDLKYQLIEEDGWRPSVAVGLRDFIGTGLYSGEYLVATKSVGSRLQVTAGLGWGRLAGRGAIGGFGTRPNDVLDEGGVPTYDRWFRGDIAPFGGLSYRVNDRLTVSAEYSSDAYAAESGADPSAPFTGPGAPLFDRKSSVNFGLDYRFKGGTQLSVYSLYGDTIGAQLSFSTNLRRSPAPSGIEGRGVGVYQRASAKSLGWDLPSTTAADAAGEAANGRARLRDALAADGLTYQRLDLAPPQATLVLRNDRYGVEPQALGRAARHMAQWLPTEIREFRIVPLVNGVPASAVIVARADLEHLQHAPADKLLKRVKIADAAAISNAPDAASQLARSNWSLGPYTQFSVFDPDNPIRIDAGLRLRASYALRPNLEVSGSLAHKIVGNLDSVSREIPSNLPRVRTDYAEYSRQGQTAIEHLTISHFGRPGTDLYSRATVGYLETMYAGVSGELLWKPVDSPLAIGAELNHVRQRDFDQRFGLRDYQTTTGHVSAYYAFGNGFHGQIDAGRYLAGDYGATIAVDREFANGWRIGAYASFTDVSAADYGEGSFDKGLRMTIPLSWVLGKPSRSENTVTLQSLTRDGAARLDVRDRLYQRVRDYHTPDLSNEWGRVWR